MKPTTNRSQTSNDHLSQHIPKMRRPHKETQKPISVKAVSLSSRELTATETRILNALSDGFARNNEYLENCLLYSDDRRETIKKHVNNINLKIHPFKIISIYTGGKRNKNLLYMLVRLIRNDE